MDLPMARETRVLEVVENIYSAALDGERWPMALTGLADLLGSVDTTLEVWEDMIHVFQAFFPMLPEGRQAVDRIGEVLRKHWS